MSFDFSTLITDRSQADVEALRALLSTDLTEWTAEQLAAFNQAASRGAYNYTDLNRVTAAMDDLNERLTALGYQTGYQRIVVPHQESGGSVLPEGYTQVAWIESTGSQYINTNFKPTNNTRFVSKVRSQEGTSSSYVWFFGCQNSWSVNGFGVSTWTAEFGNTNTTTGISLYDNKWHELDFNKGTLKIDGNTVWTGQGTFQCSNSLFLFSLNDNGTPSGLRGEMREILVYEENELIFDYIPCINPSGEAGLYGLINNQFYGNVGTGAFAAGPEVPPEPEPEPLDPYTWYEIDVPTASTMAAYLANVAALRGVLTLPDNTAAVPADMDGLTVDEANAIEEILLVIEDYLTALQKIFLRSGMAWAVSGGPGFYFKN